MTYHVTPEGKADLCRVTTGTCPFKDTPGFDELHFESKAEAQVAAERYVEVRANLEEFPRLYDPSFVFKQARAYYAQDKELGHGNNPYRNANVDDWEERRFRDYEAGFEAGIEYEADEEPRKERLRETSPIRPGAGTFDRTAFRMGYARALRMRDDEGEFLKGEVRVSGASRATYAKARFVTNPFKRGDEILLPAGTEYTTGFDTNGGVATKKLTKPVRVKIDQSFGNWADTNGDRLYLHPAQISYSTSPRAPWRDVVITPELLSANGRETFEEVPATADFYQEPIHADIDQWAREDDATEQASWDNNAPWS
jgi:hypothetical protein